MNKFNIGDKVRIIEKRLGFDKREIGEGFIESVDNSDSSLTFYDIKDMNGKIIFYHISENVLELLPINEFEKAMIQFTSDKENTQLFQEYDKSYMEGVISHMNEAGIDPETNDPKDFIYFQEMAGRLPDIKVDKKGKEILIIAVGDRENRGEAHFHVYRSETDLRKWKNGACLLFKENKYFDHGDNSETLTKDELSVIVECLKSKPVKNKYPGNTYWEVILGLWNMSNPSWEIDLDIPMPDYDYKTITRYKESK